MTAHPYGPGWPARRQAAFKAKGRLCWWCGAEATTVDHVLAVVLGGSNDLDNLVPACARCNYSRGARLSNRLRGARRHGVQVAAGWRSSRVW